MIPSSTPCGSRSTRATPTTTSRASPAAWRGALSGTGDLDVQIDVTVQGPMDKATLEQHCEQLPDVPDATYAARFRIEAPAAGETPAANVAPEAEVS